MVTDSLLFRTLHVPWLLTLQQYVTSKHTLAVLHNKAKYTSGRQWAGRNGQMTVESGEWLRD